MRSVVLGVCLFAAACSGQASSANVAHERKLAAGCNCRAGCIDKRTAARTLRLPDEDEAGPQNGMFGESRGSDSSGR